MRGSLDAIERSSAWSSAWKCSIVRLGTGALLNLAMWWTTAMASSSWPLDRRNLARERSCKGRQSVYIRTKSNKQNTYLGDSWKLKTANRMRKTKSVTGKFEKTKSGTGLAFAVR